MKLLAKIVASAALVLAFAAAAVSLVYRPAPFVPGSESARRLAPGPHAVAVYREQFVDSSRATPANGEFPGAAQRELRGAVWYPKVAADGPFPLLIYSHGFTSTHRNGGYLAEHLASYGFVVVAVDYPLTAWGAPGGPTVRDVVNQPGDISFLIDTLRDSGASPDHPLAGRVDSERVGVFGISLGGLTSMLAGFHPRFSDPRIDAVLNIAGPTVFFNREFFSHREPAFMTLAGSEDVLVPHPQNVARLASMLPETTVVSVSGGSHTGFSGGTAWLRFMRNTDAVGCWSVQRNVREADFVAVSALLGDRDLGVEADARLRLCEVEPLPEAMNVLRQQMIARVVATAFFEQVLAADPRRRQAAGRYLADGLAGEVPEIRRVRAPAGDTARR